MADMKHQPKCTEGQRELLLLQLRHRASGQLVPTVGEDGDHPAAPLDLICFPGSWARCVFSQLLP